MGILDTINDPLMAMGMGLLSASGPSARPIGVGQGLGMGMQEMQRQQMMNEKRKQAEMLQKMQQMQMDEMIRAQKKQEVIQALAKQSVLSPEQQAIGRFGPTNEGAAAIGQFKPQFDTEGFLSRLMGEDPLQAMQLKQSMKKAPIKLGEGDQLRDPDTYAILAKGSPKADSVPSAIKEYQFAVDQGFKGSFQDFVLQQKRAGAGVTNILNDNLGLKPKDRFEMEDKLRNDYTKAIDTDQKILNATSKLKQVLSGDPNAMKDQAAIYSFAKVLDPDGAVRESDYAAVLNTAGIADRFKNYLKKIETGEMLGETQRKQMLGIMQKWEDMAKAKVASQQKSYGSRAKMYNLMPENIFQPDADPLGIR